MSGQSVTLNRNLRAAWLIEALRLRANGLSTAEATEKLEELVAHDIQGIYSRRKSLRYLRQLWLEPHPEFTSLQEEAFEIYRNDSREIIARNLSVFMLFAVYPFAQEVAEACGQLLRLQGTVKTEQIKRKIIAKYGEREHVLRSVRNGLSIFTDLGILKLEKKRGTYVPGIQKEGTPDIAAFALEALFRSAGKSQMARSNLDGHPALFAFDASSLVSAAIADPRFGLSRESMTREIVNFNGERAS